MTERETPFNPFPGLRPYEPDEDYLFFGREEEVDDLLRRLRTNRFLAVVGISGCGKSSLVRSGLIPALHSGTMVKAGSSWRVTILRPGEDPIGHLATALDAPGMIGAPAGEREPASRALLDAALRRGTRGLVEAIRQARVPSGDNVLIVVDQFEELFRFRRGDGLEQSRDEAAAFVKLLLEAARQDEIPIYVVLTMRADFIGECVEYQGLPEALNASQYLVPRLTRDELRAAITGPVAVAGGRITSRLVVRILNDLGSDQDQLPVLQHALMRTWEHWTRMPAPGEAIDIPHYEAVGTLKDALSRHAEEAYREVDTDEGRRIAERVFKALTDTIADPRGTRRPCSVRTLAAIAGASEAGVARIVDVFRRPGRTFLMPPLDVPLSGDVIVDISHESLMRCWTRLISWTEEERASASVYLRLSRAAGWFDEGTAGLWRDPELELGLRWKRETRPSSAWASRYDDAFERAMRFLARSEEERAREQAARTAARRRRLRQLQGTVLLLAVLLAYAVWSGLAARRSYTLAEQNLRDAVRAVDESLKLVDRDPAKLGIDHAEIVEFRRDLAEKAGAFYREFIKRGYTGESLRQSMASAHFGLGHANRVLGDRARAAEEYRAAIEQFGGLARDFPDTAQHRRDLANAHTFLGETLRLSRDTYDPAEQAYASAIGLQEQLLQAHPGNVDYQQDLARTRYNRGILLSDRGTPLADTPTAAEAADLDRAATDFREAIRLLEPLADGGRTEEPSQGLARALNNLGNLLSGQATGSTEAERLIQGAVTIHEGLRKRFPDNREYSIELAKFFNNLASVQRDLGKTPMAGAHSDRAIELLRGLARPAPSLSIDQADSHIVRGWILEDVNVREALDEYRRALAIFEGLDQDQRAPGLPEFHLRFGDLLVNLAVLGRERPRDVDARRLLQRAVNRYFALAGRTVESGTREEAQLILGGMSRLFPELSDRDRADVNLAYKEWEARLRERAASPSK